MKKRFIMLGIVCLFMTGCQTAQKTIPEITTIAPADSAHEETETNKEERAEDASVAVKSLKIGSSKGNPDDLSSLYQTIQTHSDHNHCKSNKHRINHLAPSGFRISNAKHKITDPDAERRSPLHFLSQRLMKYAVGMPPTIQTKVVMTAIFTVLKKIFL